MLMSVFAALLSCLAWSPGGGPAPTGAVEVVASVQRSCEVVGTVVAFGSGTTHLLPGGTGTPGTTPEQVLTTTVQDPEHPGEPWVITTYRRPDESFEAFIKRHRDMVDAVRRALDG
jgi:hypothetical protein